MRVIVTGAAGFIGSHLVDRLLDRGDTVIGIDSFEDYYPRELKLSNIAAADRSNRFELLEADVLQLAQADIGRPSPLEGLLDGADLVFHLAAQAGVREVGGNFETYVRNNILATQRMLEACVAHGTLQRFVYASSSSVYGDTDRLPMVETAVCRPVSPYGVTKLAAEHLTHLYFQESGVPTTALRFFSAFGPRQRPDMAFNKYIRTITAGKAIDVYGGGAQTRDFTFIGDIIDGIVACIDSEPGRVFNLGGGSRVTLLEAIRVLERVLGTTAVVNHLGAQKGDVRDTWAELGAARDAFDFAPRVTLEEGLRLEAEWLFPAGARTSG